jgi:LysM repeat protein
MTNYFDDDSFWDEPGSRRTESTSQVTRTNQRTERTRSHHVVVRGTTPPPPLDFDDPSDDVWLEPAPRFGLFGRNSDRLGAFGNIDPRLLSIGAIAIVGVLAVPLFGAFSGDDGDDGFRSLPEAAVTTTTAAPATTAPAEIVVTAAVNPEIEDDPADTEATSDGESGNGASAFGVTGGGGGETVAALDVPDSCTNRYEVVAGDFWLGIAEKAGVELDALLAANGAENGTAIYPGSEVCLPGGASIGSGQGNGASGDGATPGGAGDGAVDPATCATTYEVVAGDFWVRIADSSGVELHELLGANGANNDTLLLPGRTICLPAGATPPTQSTPAPTTAAPTTPAPTTAPPATDPPTTPAPPTTDPPTTEAPETTRPQTPIPSGGEVEALIRQIWPDDLEDRAVEIAWRESNFRPDVTSSTGCCVGVFQVHWEAHKSWLIEMGISSRDELFDARTNIEAAYALYQRSGGWGPWAL